MQAQDPETATYYFMWGWERPSKAAGNSSLVKRQTAAERIMTHMLTVN